MDQQPVRWLPSSVSTLLCMWSYDLVGLQKSWSICLICRHEWAACRAVKPCRWSCHQVSQRVLPVTSLSDAGFTGRSSENVLPCLKQLLLGEHDFHGWRAWGDSPSLAFRVRNADIRGRQSERLQAGEGRTSELTELGGKQCKHLWEGEGGRDACERTTTKRRTWVKAREVRSKKNKGLTDN